MGDQRERNRIKSRVDELPDEIRAQLDAMLADVNYTYQDIADTITDLGYEISRSAVGRYAMRHNSAARRLKEASEQTTALLQFIRENQDVESTELASAIMIDGLTRRIATADEDFDAMPLDKAGRPSRARGVSSSKRASRDSKRGSSSRRFFQYTTTAGRKKARLSLNPSTGGGRGKGHVTGNRQGFLSHSLGQTTFRLLKTFFREESPASFCLQGFPV